MGLWRGVGRIQCVEYSPFEGASAVFLGRAEVAAVQFIVQGGESAHWLVVQGGGSFTFRWDGDMAK